MTEQDPPGDLGYTHKYIIALLGLEDGEPVPEGLWLQKEIFLISRVFETLEEECGYIPHLMGPYSEEVEVAAEELQALGLIEADAGKYDFRLTDEGRALFERLRPRIPEEVIDIVSRHKRFLNDMSDDELLTYIYGSFPDMTVNSVKMDRVMEKRMEMAKRLYQKRKVSLEKAADLAGMRILEFKREIADEVAGEAA